MTILPEFPDLVIEQVAVTSDILITLRSISPTAYYPCCGTVSRSVQSRYSRRLHDLPGSRRPAHLLVHVRRFYCKKGTCAQKIFAERLKELCHPHALRTKRLQEALSQLELVVGG